MRPQVATRLINIMDLGESHSSSSSSASFNGSFYETSDEQTLEEREGAQPYSFEPYDSEASSGMDSLNESKEGQFKRLQNTDWYVSDQLYLVSQVPPGNEEDFLFEGFRFPDE